MMWCDVMLWCDVIWYDIYDSTDAEMGKSKGVLNVYFSYCERYQYIQVTQTSALLCFHDMEIRCKGVRWEFTAGKYHYQITAVRIISDQIYILSFVVIYYVVELGVHYDAL